MLLSSLVILALVSVLESHPAPAKWTPALDEACTQLQYAFMELSVNEVPQQCLVDVADIYEDMPMAYGCELESSNLRQYMKMCTQGPYGMYDMAHCLAEFLNAVRQFKIIFLPSHLIDLIIF